MGSATAAEGDDRIKGEGIVAAKPVLREPWSADRLAKLFVDPKGGPMFPHAKCLIFDAEIDGKTVRSWLPDNLEPVEPAKATVYVADFARTSVGIAYHESAVFLHCLFEEKRHAQCAWMVVDDDTALIHGRELSGFPKKYAVVNVDAGSDRPHALVTRKGYRVLEMSGSNGKPVDRGKMIPLPVLNVRGVPGMGPADLLRLSGGERFHWGKEFDFEVSIGETELDPLYRLGIQPKQKGKLLCVDLGAADAGSKVDFSSGVVGSVSPLWVVKACPFRSY